MKAGRELDALVATKVMGWVTVKSHHLSWVNGLGGLVTWESTSFGSFQPSSDIAAAWTVVERMHQLGRHFLLMSTFESGLSIASFYLGPHDRTELSATAPFDEAPWAICRAALKAVGVEV